MKKGLLAILVSFTAVFAWGQELSWTPDFPQESTTPFTVTLDATKGNQGLMGYTPVTDVYVHIGVITNLSTSSSDWKYSKFTWATTTAAAQCTSLGSNKWSFTITGGLRTFFGISNAGESIQKIAILFRNGAGTKVQRNADGSDMYIPIYTTALGARFSLPYKQPTYIPIPETITTSVGNTIPMTGIANAASALKLYFNGATIQTAAGATTISASPTIAAAGNQQLVMEAKLGITTIRDTINFYVPGTVTVQDLPAGVREGINYEAATDAVTLVLYAPGKNRVCLIGDLPGSNWIEQSAYQFKKTTNGNYWWLRITGLTPGTEYSYQYLIDGTLKVGDPYTEKVLDPWNDQYISSTTYPGLKAYPTNLTSGVVSTLQTGQAAYNWQTTNFTRPDKGKLVIYETLMRDFLANHDWKTINDTLNYLRNLGVTAIQLMPINEFEGNLSWGYNPDYYFAPDKYYGPKNDLKQFIDNCHSKGIAVIMDIALNHSFGLSPQVQMYWDAVNNRPAANNPWFNPVAKHAFNVGYDYNHESLATRYFVSRVLEHWLVNYKIDGFRFDLSKGFTQTQTCDGTGNNCDVNGWSAYDASRIAIWKRYYDTLQLKSSGCYAILEHFADNSEEKELSNYGLMLWGNENYHYSQATQGWAPSADFSSSVFNSGIRGWSNPYLVSYMESHDEERLMYLNLNSGNSYNGYNIRSLNTALKRMELAGAFFFTIPGPKMIWEFGELGYDFSINYCQDGTINSNCRLDSKPIRWDYKNVAERNSVYNTWSALAKLRKSPTHSSLFTSSNAGWSFSNYFKWYRCTQGNAQIVVVGNFDVAQQTGSVDFPAIAGGASNWYNYLTQTAVPTSTISTGAHTQSFTLQPGEFFVYTNGFVPIPVTIINFTGRGRGTNNLLTWKVAQEQNMRSYDVERSTDGINFTRIGSVLPTGNSEYSYVDDVSGLHASTYYYRLRSIDLDGDFRFSTIVRIKATINGLYVSATNPFSKKLQVTVDAPSNDRLTIMITDFSGKLLLKKEINVLEGTNAFEIPEAANFANGMYVMKVTGSEQSQTIKLIKGN